MGVSCAAARPNEFIVKTRYGDITSDSTSAMVFRNAMVQPFVVASNQLMVISTIELKDSDVVLVQQPQGAGCQGRFVAQRALPENRLHPSPTLRILLADDCTISQMMTRAVLARWSIHLHSAVDGRDAIHQALSTRFDMVLIAVELPECDGFEVATFIRAYESGNGLTRVPIVAYSNSPRVLDLDGMIKAGIDDVLAKPCHTDTLAACLYRWLPREFATAAEVKDRVRIEQQKRRAILG
jgi:CheY-like chemotaxis protein